MTRTERGVLAIVVALVVLAPVGFGSVPGFDLVERNPDPWMAFFMALGPWHLFLALGLTLLAIAGARGTREEEAPAWLPIRLLAGLVALGILQLVPLPDFLARVLAPTARAHREALGVGAGPISWLPGWTVREIARLGASIGILAAAALALRSRRARWIAAGAIVAVGAGEAVYGLLERFVLGNGILGFTKLTGTAEVTGTFIDRNHLAALLEIAIPTALAMLVFRRRAPGRDGRRPFGALDVALGAAAALMIAAVPLTLSRAGIGALFAGLLVFLYLVYGRRAGKARRATLVVFVLLLAVVPVLLVASLGGLERRFSYGVSDRGYFDIRFPAWESTLRLVADQPVLGTGLGSYREAIHAYQSTLVPDELVYAHDDSLNLLADGGVVGLLLGFGFALSCAWPAWRRAGGPEGQARTLGIAALAAMAGVGAHSVFEFGLQIPGVTVPLLVLVGLGMTTARPPAERRTGWPRVVLRGVAAAAAVALLAVAARDELRAGRARAFLRAGETERAAELFASSGDDLGEGRARLAVAEARQAEGEDAAGAFSRARRALRAATGEAPLRAEPWFVLGLVDFAQGKVDDAMTRFGAARRFARGRGEMNYQIGATMMLVGLQRRDDALVGEGADALREAGTLEPELFTRGFDVVGRYVRDVAVLRRMTPDTVYGRTRLVGLLRKLGRREEAVEEMRRLIRLEPTEERIFGLGEILISDGRYDEAAEAMERYLREAGLRERTLDAVYRQYVAGRRRGPARDLFARVVRGPGRGVAHAHYLLALLESDLGHHEAALEAIRRAIELDGGRDGRYARKLEAILSDR